VEFKPEEAHFDRVELDGQQHEAVPLLPCSIDQDPEQAGKDQGPVVPEVPVQYKG
jgi:hypothetical protein